MDSEPVAVVDGERVEDGFPAVDLADCVGAVGYAFADGEIEHLHAACSLGKCPRRRVARRKGVERLDGFGIRYDISDVSAAVGSVLGSGDRVRGIWRNC